MCLYLPLGVLSSDATKPIANKPWRLLLLLLMFNQISTNFGCIEWTAEISRGKNRNE